MLVEISHRIMSAQRKCIEAIIMIDSVINFDNLNSTLFAASIMRTRPIQSLDDICAITVERITDLIRFNT